jgi:hypothetical protein
MRAAFNAISGLQDEVLKEVDKKPLSEIRRKALLAITEQYEELEQVYLGAYDEADMSFKFAALKVNKQQLEKQILEKVTSMSKDIESMKDFLQTLGRVLFLSLSPEAREKCEEEGLLPPNPDKSLTGDNLGNADGEPDSGAPMDVDIAKGKYAIIIT